MTSARTARAAGVGIVMTDLFVSAAAALMMILAITRPTPDIPLPVQADFLATCLQATQAATDEAGLYTLSLTPNHAESEIQPVIADAPGDLWTLPDRFGEPPRLFYTIALVDGAEPVTGACADWALNDLVRTANSNADSFEANGTSAPPPIYGLKMATREEPVE